MADLRTAPRMTDSKFQSAWSALRDQIDAALKVYSTFDEDCPARLQDAIQYALLAPGKRLRPTLVLLAAEACGGTAGQAMPAACALEMVHVYSLIHDDLPAMDDDDLRRGQPSCHIRFDEATAILAGDALLARAFELLAREMQPAEVAAACCATLGWACGPTALVGGQCDDLQSQTGPQSKLSPSWTNLEHIHRRKTGALFEAAVRIGGLAGGGTKRQLDSLQTYGSSLGLAFQVTDDLLDVSGDEHTIGKRVQKDNGRGKLNYAEVLGIDAARQRAVALASNAIAALEQFGTQGDLLRELAEFVTTRKR